MQISYVYSLLLICLCSLSVEMNVTQLWYTKRWGSNWALTLSLSIWQALWLPNTDECKTFCFRKPRLTLPGWHWTWCLQGVARKTLWVVRPTGCLQCDDLVPCLESLTSLPIQSPSSRETIEKTFPPFMRSSFPFKNKHWSVSSDICGSQKPGSLPQTRLDKGACFLFVQKIWCIRLRWVEKNELFPFKLWLLSKRVVFFLLIFFFSYSVLALLARNLTITLVLWKPDIISWDSPPEAGKQRWALAHGHIRAGPCRKLDSASTVWPFLFSLQSLRHWAHQHCGRSVIWYNASCPWRGWWRAGQEVEFAILW